MIFGFVLNASTARVLSLIAAGWFVLLATEVSAADITVAEAGARYGQALAGAKFCPGGKVTAKAEALPGTYTSVDATKFKSEAENVTKAWDKAFACVEFDPTANRSTECRKMRLTSCRQAWIEIGPEGRNLPGLLDVDFSAWADKHPEPQ